MKKNTAKEARTLAGVMSKMATDSLRECYARIKKSALDGRTYIVMRGKLYDTYKSEDKWSEGLKEVVADLRKNGFECSSYYNELQFVDIGLKISWEN